MSDRFLSSWKEISAYTGYSERTVQRWERTLGLPVRRPAGRSRSAVISLTSEIDAWFGSAPTLPQQRSRTTSRDAAFDSPSTVAPNRDTRPAEASKPSALSLDSRPGPMATAYSLVTKYRGLAEECAERVAVLKSTIEQTARVRQDLDAALLERRRHPVTQAVQQSE